jgi:hypothetical protein
MLLLEGLVEDGGVALGRPVAGAVASAPALTARTSATSSRPLSGLGLLGLSTRTAEAHKKIQMAATTMVMRVKMSPALVPSALWPPGPPKAPTKPPPRPRWTKTSMTRNTEVTKMAMPNTY